MDYHGLFQAATCSMICMIRHQYFQFRSGTSQIRKMNRYHHLQVKKCKQRKKHPAGGGFSMVFPWDFCWTELTNLAFIKVGDVTLRDDIDLQTASCTGTLPFLFLTNRWWIRSPGDGSSQQWKFTSTAAVDLLVWIGTHPFPGENQPSTLPKGIPKGGKVD